MLKIGVLVSGRGSNLQSIIDSIENGDLDAKIKLVVSDRKKAFALERADRHKINNIYLDPKQYKNKEEYEQKIIDIFKEKDVDLVIMAGFMRILTPYFIRHFRQRVMNIHPSLLPSFPGLHPQRQALESGVKVSGCTVHFADEGMDTGPIILQAAVPVLDNDDEDTLAARILQEEHSIYPQAIKLFAEGKMKIEGRSVKILDK